ncbi:MAG: hypothetical protein ABIF01_03060 [Candidatus Micrarchaeota archaeon]
MMDKKGQMSLEGLVAISAFLAFLLVFVVSFANLHARANSLGESLSARSCANDIAELAGYYSLDAAHSGFPLELKNVIDVNGEVHCRRGAYNSTSKALVVRDEKEPI